MMTMSWTIPDSRLLDADFGKLADVRPLVERLKNVFGLTALAAVLNADKGNLSRFLSGTRGISGDIAQRAIDVDHVLTRAAQIFESDVIGDWLTGYDQQLGGRPIDVLTVQGAGPLIDTLDRIESGGYA